MGPAISVACIKRQSLKKHTVLSPIDFSMYVYLPYLEVETQNI
jgi:hypothetical protein